MTDRPRSEDDGEGLSPEEIRTLRAWVDPAPPDGFGQRVLALARARRAAASSSEGARAPARTRGERERRQRRRSALAAALAAVALGGAGGFVVWQAAGGLAVAEAAHTAMAVYLAALAFGGVLLVASLVGGHDHGDAHAGTADGHTGHGDAHAHDENQRAPDVTAAPHASLVLPFLSLRFWIFGLAFFGLTGAVLSGLGLAGPAGAAVAATLLGLATGYTAGRLFQTLARQSVGDIRDGGCVGREGTLLLPVSKAQRGKVRLVVHGVTTDLVAESDDEAALPTGTTVLVVAMRGTVAVVERSPTTNQTAD